MNYNTTNQVLRPLGAFERTIDLYMHRNPVQFSLTAELTRDVSEEELTGALRKLQRVHPLLAAGVDRGDHDGHRAADAVFRRSAGAITVRVALGTTWEREAAIEQTELIEPAPGPLARAVLIPAGDGLAGETGRAGTTVVVTFAHQITDGRGALRAVEDLAAILDGATPAPSAIPASQEELLSDLTPTANLDDGATRSDAEPTEKQGTDATAPPPGELRPFDGSPPVVQSGDLGAWGTRRLIERARAESCTVGAALCAAAATVLFARAKQDRVRINVPIDLRRAADLDDDVVVRFGATMVVLDRSPGMDFWDLARDATAQLGAAREPETVRASALALAGLAPATAGEAEAAMLAATASDIEITNLGMTHTSAAERNVQALWGPTMTTQVAGEQILGVVTHGDVLRMANVTHAPMSGLVEDISRELEAACR